ncbi:MAG: hypothetical protein HXK06_06720 [Actinomyces graevenitzii]|nr:hypothetical protein [Actinomyces graevenitzii]
MAWERDMDGVAGVATAPMQVVRLERQGAGERRGRWRGRETWTASLAWRRRQCKRAAGAASSLVRRRR